MKKLFSAFIIGLVIGALVLPIASAATAQQTTQETQNQTTAQTQTQVQTGDLQAKTPVNKQDFFKARIAHITNQGQQVGLDGIKTYLQSYKLKALDGKWKNKEINITNSEFNTIGLNAFKEGDVLLLAHNTEEQGQDQFYGVD